MNNDNMSIEGMRTPKESLLHQDDDDGVFPLSPPPAPLRKARILRLRFLPSNTIPSKLLVPDLQQTEYKQESSNDMPRRLLKPRPSKISPRRHARLLSHRRPLRPSRIGTRMVPRRVDSCDW